MRKLFRIHGDNIVECERLAALIIKNLKHPSIHRSFTSLACMAIDLDFTRCSKQFSWRLELFPGFNKSRNDRWKSNILQLLKERGSFLDEAPDVLLTCVEHDIETVLMAIEFCSALQAGNQAWQRSGRAYSTGRTGVPYLYIVDFVKCELDPFTRNPKFLRYPNAAVPYSYISHAKRTGNFVAQAYFKAEEFYKVLSDFDTDIFAEHAVGQYVICKMLKKPTIQLEKEILYKNLMMVEYLSKRAKSGSNYTEHEWNKLYQSGCNIIDDAVKKRRFGFKKKIAQKSMSGKVETFNTLVQKYSIGFASEDLPFGIIPQTQKADFARELFLIYPAASEKLTHILQSDQDLIICMLKGFKPGGDDNRPDRGALPFIAMLAGEHAEILTFIYGPISKKILKILDDDILKMATNNGLWHTLVGLSDLIIIDSPIIGANQVHRVIENSGRKRSILDRQSKKDGIEISNVPNRYQENDVDTIIHFLFKHIGNKDCFEGMCNPPGGDWSGLSIVESDTEYRWLSLPRVSGNGKRPDHAIQFEYSQNKIILSIESKERGKDLEPDVGEQLKSYIEYLMQFSPNVQREFGGEWQPSHAKLVYENYCVVSAGAYISTGQTNLCDSFQKTKCDILFELSPVEQEGHWKLRLTSNTPAGHMAECFVRQLLSKLGSGGVIQVEAPCFRQGIQSFR